MDYHSTADEFKVGNRFCRCSWIEGRTLQKPLEGRMNAWVCWTEKEMTSKIFITWNYFSLNKILFKMNFENILFSEIVKTTKIRKINIYVLVKKILAKPIPILAFFAFILFNYVCFW